MLQDITFPQTRALLDYMYHGEVSVQEEELPALLKIAEALKVKGLVEAEDNFAAMTSARRAAGGTGGRTGGLGPVASVLWGPEGWATPSV